MKKVGSVVLIMAMVLSLTGCAGGFDASKYVKGIMENVYYGEATNYMELVEITKEEAYEEYESGIKVEADYFVQYYNLEEISDDVYQTIVDMYKEIYKAAKFDVKDAVKNGDDYNVEVVISPISLITDSEDEIIEKWEELNNTLNPDDYASNMEINDEYANAVISVIKKNMSNIGYGADKSVIVKVEKDTNGYYMISDDAMMNLDTEVIAY